MSLSTVTNYAPKRKAPRYIFIQQAKKRKQNPAVSFEKDQIEEMEAEEEEQQQDVEMQADQAAPGGGGR